MDDTVVPDESRVRRYHVCVEVRVVKHWSPCSVQVVGYVEKGLVAADYGLSYMLLNTMLNTGLHPTGGRDKSGPYGRDGRAR